MWRSGYTDNGIPAPLFFPTGGRGIRVLVLWRGAGNTRTPANRVPAPRPVGRPCEAASMGRWMVGLALRELGSTVAAAGGSTGCQQGRQGQQG